MDRNQYSPTRSFIVRTLQRLSWEYAVVIPAITTIRTLLSEGVLKPIWKTLDDEQERIGFDAV